MLKKYSDLIFIFILTFIILWLQFFFKTWTYFLLDSVPHPIYEMSWFFEVSIFWHLDNALNMLFWYAFYSKIFLFSLVFFTWFLWLQLSNLVSDYFKIEDKYKKTLWYIWILFFLLNPFFYERTITQPWISFWFMLIWFWLYFLLKNHKYVALQHICSWIFFWLAFSVMNHSLFMVLLIYLLYLIFFVRSKKTFLYLILSWVIFLTINLNWLIWNFFLDKWTTLNYVNTINQSNINNFTTNSLNNLWEELTSLLLYWFWWERWARINLPDLVNTKWYYSWFIILFVILVWFIKSLFDKNYRKLSMFLSLIWFISYILWVWIIAKWWFISQFLYDNLPFYNWLREPQKWIWLLTIVYGIFFIYWIYNILIFFDKNIKFKYNNIFVVVFVFLFLNAWNPNTLFWFNYQLFISDYPKSYFDLRNNEIKNNYKENKYLVFPWHSYMACDYTNLRVVANIMGSFFKPLNLVISDNIEVWTLYTNSSSSESKDVENFIDNQNIDLLKKNKFTHIIMLKTCWDFSKYSSILEEQTKKSLLKKEHNSPKISIYKIQ